MNEGNFERIIVEPRTDLLISRKHIHAKIVKKFLLIRQKQF